MAISEYTFAHMPGHLIRRAHQRAVAAFAESTKGFDITPLQFALLSALAQSPQDVDQVTLAQRAALDTSTAASTLDRMQAKGWIERRLDAQDRRRRVLHITAAGARHLRRVESAVVCAQSEMLAPLSRAEQRALCALLVKLSKEID
jgi:DNA-binding MarR family transcriptional regulator